MFGKAVIPVALAALMAVGILAPAEATSLAFEFGSGGAGFSVEVSPRAKRGGWVWDGGARREPARLSPQDIRRGLLGQGFRDIQNLRLRGAIYQARAVDPGGQPVGLVLNARNGAILNIYRTR